MIKFVENFFKRRSNSEILENIKIDHKYFSSINNPTDEMCKLAMTCHFDHFYEIKNPSDDLIILAITLDSSYSLLKKIKNYNNYYRICKESVLFDPLNIWSIDFNNLSQAQAEDIVFSCLYRFPRALPLIKNLSPEYCLKCLNAYPNVFSYISIVQSISPDDCQKKLQSKIKLLDLMI